MPSDISAALPPAAARPYPDVQLRALHFTTALLCACLFLQRFALPLGAKPINIVGPIGLGLVALGLVQGTLAFHRVRLAAFLALAALATTGLMWQDARPDGGELNLNSMAQFVLLSSFAVVTFAQPVEEARFFRIFTRWLGVIALCGIAQFAAQFVGVHVFAFTGLLPTSILFESGYNLVIPVGVAELFKSNGFFLVEPSVFSQFMAIGLIIEILAFHRPRYFAVFALGLLLSFSGTGWMVLGSFVVAAVLGMGWRGVAIGGATVLLLAVLLGAAQLAAPDFVHALVGRFGEFSQPGTSGFQRFVTPFWALQDALDLHPSALLMGLGSGVSERLPLPYAYDVNTPVKIGLEYGVFGLAAYLMLFFAHRRSPVQTGLLAPACMLFFVTGAYQQFPPVVFLTLLLTSVARLAPSDAAAFAREAAA